MENYAISIRLTDLINTVILDLPTKKPGVTKKHICIPIDENFLVQGKSVQGKGDTYYLALSAWEHVDKDTGKKTTDYFGYTHYLKKDIPKSAKQQLNDTEELRRLTPYVGGMKPIARKEKPIYPSGDHKPKADTVDRGAVKTMSFDPEDLPY
jgi:hypothetical protein